MEYVKEQVAARVDVAKISQFLALASVATLLPFFIHLQWVTGPIVNAILILVLFIVGIRSALVLSFIPSMIALARGLLPAVLAPAVPFIMLGNVIFVLSIEFIYSRTKNSDKGFWLGAALGSGLKFLFLFSSVQIIGGLLIKQELTMKVAQLLSWPQFATAMTGALIAWFILKKLKRF